MSKLALMALMLTSAFAAIDGRAPAFAAPAQTGLVPVSDDGIYDRDDDDDDDDGPSDRYGDYDDEDDDDDDESAQGPFDDDDGPGADLDDGTRT